MRQKNGDAARARVEKQIADGVEVEITIAESWVKDQIPWTARVEAGGVAVELKAWSGSEADLRRAAAVAGTIIVHAMKSYMAFHLSTASDLREAEDLVGGEDLDEAARASMRDQETDQLEDGRLRRAEGKVRT